MSIALQGDFQSRQEIRLPGAGVPRPCGEAASVHVQGFQPPPGLPEADISEMPEVFASKALQQSAAFPRARGSSDNSRSMPTVSSL